MADTKKQPVGQPDYGNNNPTGGTKENTGKLNPQGPTSGTENMNPNRKNGQQTTARTANTDTDQNADKWAERAPQAASEPSNFATGPVSPNAGDVQDEGGNLDPGASATPGAGVGNTQGQPSFRCADAGFADCRWETSMASTDQLWSDIEHHACNEHGMKSLDERTRGKIQDAIHVRRAA
jgi:predicted small metal-binding protein